MDCPACEYHRVGDTVSMDVLVGEEKVQLMDTLKNRALHGCVFARLREFAFGADTIIAMWQGMLGIFAVMALITLIVMLFTRFSK